MEYSEVERILGHYNRLLSHAADARKRGQPEFADSLVARASKYLDQIAALESQSSAQRHQPHAVCRFSKVKSG